MTTPGQQTADRDRGEEPDRIGRATQIGLAVVLGLALTGYFVGLGGNPSYAPPAPRPVYHAAERVDAAETYDRMRRTKPEPVELAQLETKKADFPTETTSPEARSEALLERATRRAFKGAPPVIPHRVDPLSSVGCLACHEKGLSVGDRSAPRMSHERYLSCTQCHVESQRQSVPLLIASNARSGVEEVPLLDGPAYAAVAGNHFEGLHEPSQGARAWPGAPPVVPHAVWMRSTCLSCHGPFGRFALRTPHPERQNCLQCHASSAILDQAPVMALPPVGGAAHP